MKVQNNIKNHRNNKNLWTSKNLKDSFKKGTAAYLHHIYMIM